MTDKAIDLSRYRLQNANDTLDAAGLCLERNLYKASKKVHAKAGFVLEGVMRKAVYKNGKVMDLCHYGLYK